MNYLKNLLEKTKLEIDQIYSEKNNKKECVNNIINKENNLDELFDVSFYSYESENNNEEENIKLNKEEKIKEKLKQNKIKTNFDHLKMI